MTGLPVSDTCLHFQQLLSDKQFSMFRKTETSSNVHFKGVILLFENAKISERVVFANGAKTSYCSLGNNSRDN